LNLTDFFIGAGIGAVVAFGTGFLKKAGEDLYTILKNKVNPKKEEKNNHKVSIEFEAIAKDRGELPDHLFIKQGLNTLNNDVIPIEKIARISAEDIYKEVKSAPPFQRRSLAERYVGLDVEWNCFFQDVIIVDDEMATILLNTIDTNSVNFVKCKVSLKEYKELGITKQNSKIRISGEIGAVDELSITIFNAHLTFLDNSA
jgi:gas vesicle protein